ADDSTDAADTVSENTLSENNLSAVEVVSDNSISDNSVSDNDISDAAVLDDSVSGNSVSENSVSENELTVSLIRVALPVKLDFAMNPDGFGGMGQILSPDYDMVNYSDVPIEVEISDIYYEFADPENCVSLSVPYDKDDSAIKGKKAFYLYLGHADLKEEGDSVRKYYDEYIDGQDAAWGSQTFMEGSSASGDDILITDEHLAEPVTLILEPSVYDEDGELISTPTSAMASFRFFGSMSTSSDVKWFSDNVSLKVVYKYKAVKSAESVNEGEN
ncbi:MAG TPA: hypothetical protein PLU43_12430, partial [Lachnospiraceae bacterium]|nr:hypothetical protein [Lachnospiraceae bacterium]